jgi:hypothetical protein
LSNTGVTSITGTVNQITANSSTGSVTLLLPQNIHTGATPTFSQLTLSGSTVTTNSPALSIAQSWNGAGIFNAQTINITNTSSSVASTFVSYQVGGVVQFAVRQDGVVTSGMWGAKIISAAFGGTGWGVYEIGDILFANTTSTLSRLTATATGNVLLSGNSPVWGKVSLITHVSGILPIAQGGTNVTTTPSNGQILIGNGAGYTLKTITGSATVGVTNTSGTITLDVLTGATGVLTASNYIIGEVPTGTLPNLSLSAVPLAGKQAVYVNGVRQNLGAGNDYTISGAMITFLTGAVPQSGDVVLVDYIK